MTEWLADLNEEQRDAATYVDGPLCILAGAGTGKTQTLTTRFIHLVRGEGVPPHQILALTFSRKAAEEMRHRVVRNLPGGYRDLSIQTFHAYCYRLISDWSQREGSRKVEVIDDAARRVIAAQVANDIPDERLVAYRGPAGRRKLAIDLLTLADRAKEHLLTPAQIRAYAVKKEPSPGRLHDLATAMTDYQERLTAGNTPDFGDFALRVTEQLRADRPLLDSLREHIRHILVDEFQDTNKAQFELIQLLTPAGAGNICVVGDPNQAIYAFRGGRPEYMTEFDRHYPGARRIALTTNYRSGASILDAANRLIAHNREVHAHELRAHPGAATARVTVTEVATIELEAEVIARRILRLVREDEQLRFGEIAILVRSLKQSQEPIIRALAANGIPYRLGREVTAGADVVQDVLAALRLVAGPPAWTDAARLVIARDGKASAIHELSCRFSPADRDALLEGTSAPAVASAQELEALRAARALVHEAASLRDLPLPMLAYEAMRLAGHLRDDASKETGRFLSGVLAQATAVAQKGATPAEFVAQLAAGHDHDDDTAPDDPGGVHLLTVHAAKGLEWPVVFVAGLADGLFPLPMRLDRDFDLDELADWEGEGDGFTPKAETERAAAYRREERRLAYVALTRGRREVHLMAPLADGRGPLRRSPFIDEILGDDACEHVSLLDDGGPAATLPDLNRQLRRRRQRALAAKIDGTDTADHLAALLLVQWAAGGPVDGAVPVRERLAPLPFAGERAIRFSYSQLDTYDTCPRQYLYAAVLRLEKDEEAASLALGSAVHTALQALNNWWQTNEAIPDDEAIIAAIDAAWPSAGFDCKAQSLQLRLRALAMLRRYYTMERTRHPARYPIAIESPFSEPYQEHTVSGRIDLVLRDGTGAVEIIDFKTGKPSSESVSKPAESLQLFLYDHVWRQKEPAATPTVAFYALRHEDDKGFRCAPEWHEKQARIHVHTEETALPLRQHIDGLLAGVLANDFEPRPADDACGRCRFRWLCPAG